MIESTEHEEKSAAVRHSSYDIGQAESRRHRSVQPAALNLGFIIGLGVVLGVLSVSDGLLWQFAKNAGGFGISSANRYLLTYGPTAVLVCVVAAWRQVDYFTKVTTPWVVLSQGSAPALRSVLLDYVSVLQVVAWWKAIGNRHYAVVLTTSGFAMLKLAMLASTGLFVLKPAMVTHTVNTTLDTVLVPKSFTVSNDTSTFDQSLFYTTYGILAQNLDKPFGVGTGLAYSTFEFPEQFLEANNFDIGVDAFVPSFQCIPATVDGLEVPANSSDLNPVVPYKLTSPACQLTTFNPSLYTLNPQLYRCPTKQLSGIMQNVNCSESVFGTNVGAHKLLLMVDIRYSQVLDESNENTKISQPIIARAWSTDIVDLTAVVCRLSYGQQKVEVSSARNRQIRPVTAQFIPASSEKQYDGFSTDDLDSLFRGALSASDGILGSRADGAYSEEYPDPMFKAMSAYNKSSYAALMNTSIMMETAGQVARQLAAQIAHQYLRANDTRSSVMNVTELSAILEVTTSAAWVVFGSLFSVAMFCFLLTLIQRKWSRDNLLVTSDSIVPSASADSSLTKTLIASQSCHEGQLSDLLASTSVYLSRDKSGNRMLSVNNEIDFQVLDESRQRWFAPITISWPVRIGAFILAIAIVVILEILQWLSDGHEGFLRLALTQNEVSDMTIRMLSAFTAVLVASLFNCLDFNILLLTPYHDAQSPTPLNYLKKAPLLSKTPLLALYSSISHGNIPASLSTTAALTGSLLAVVVSGLFSPKTTYIDSAAQVNLLDQFLPQWQSSVFDDRGAALLSSLIENLNFTFPQATFNEVAMPSLELSSGQKQVLPNSTIIARLPVWRGDLQCVSLAPSNVSISPSRSRFNNIITVNASYGLPSTCAYGGPNGTDPTLQFVQTFTIPQSQNSSYVGKLLDLHVGPYDPVLGSAQNELNPMSISDNPIGCPSIALLYGSIDFTTGFNRIAVDVCTQHIQTMSASIQFSDTRFNVDRAELPSIDESALQYLHWDGQATEYTPFKDNATAFQFRLQSHFDNVFAVFNTTNSNPFTKMSSSRPAVDPFFQGVIFGRSALPLDTLRIRSDRDLARVRACIQSFYRRYMAQAISLNMRVLINSTNLIEQQKITVEVKRGILQKRLAQNENSKLILQAMLAFMLICGLIIQWKFKMQKLLPESVNPCTVWGQMSLWAGEEDLGTRDKQHENGNSYSEHNPRDSYTMVQLGWWDLQNGQRRYGFETFPGI